MCFKDSRHGRVRVVVCGFFLLFCLRPAVLAAGRGGRVDNSWDIAVIDRALAAEKAGDCWIPFGDVGLSRAQLLEFRARLMAQQESRAEPEAVTPPGTAAYKWPGGLVYYRFNPTQVGNGTITAGKMQQFRDGIAEWAAFANLTFVENISGQPHYITVEEDPSLGGGLSTAVGRDQMNAEQFVRFGPNAWNRGTICHEVGHALGLYHEQQRSDRDSFVTILTANIAAGQEPNFAKLPAPPGGSTNIGPYDFYSVMHYARDALSSNGQDTTQPLPAYAQFLNIMGRVTDRTLSKLDRAGMGTMYGAPAVAPSAVVTNRNDSGSGSLRAAIYYAFDRSTDPSPTPTTVTFNITGSPVGNVFTIRPTYALVAPGANTTIDGSTQTAFSGDTNTSGPEVVIDGSQIAAQNLGLFAPGFILRETGCTIKNLVINGFNTQGVRIDGTTAALNLTSASANTISGCYIGTDATGTVGVGNGNGWPGVELFGGAINNTIGGLTSNARNVISGSTGHGIVIQNSGTNGNVVLGNYIGTNAAGTGALSNAFAGVAIYGGAQNNTIGGLTSGARNILSGNKLQGFFFADSGTNGNVALGNYIGLNAAGTAALANGNANFATHSFFPGCSIYNGAQNNAIGGTSAGAGNVISGNTGQGVVIATSGTTGNIVRGNLIGTNPAGTAAIGNGFADTANGWRYSGLDIFGGAQSNIIGGTTSGAGNVLSGNAAQGMTISGSGSNANLVQGNYIGTNAAGTAAVANFYSGIELFGGPQSNTIGGNVPGAGNLISGNSGRGIGFFDASTQNNSVLGNLIGLNAAGTGALANAFSGVECYLASNNTIGGTSPGARNYLSGNGDRGVVIDGADATGNKVIGNTIGRTKSGTALANGTQGVALFTGAHGNFIGGSLPGESNVISANSNEGVALYDAATIANTISRNSIYLNGFAGIGRYTGSNNNQAAPILTSAIASPAGNPNGMDISGSITGAATVEFFANPSGDDEGRYFLGAYNASGGSFTASLAVSASPNSYIITATATAAGSTSQFSNTVGVGGADSDSDGIPDTYETAHLLNPSSNDANADADGDGLSNYQEFRAGTDPQVASSAFRVVSETRSGSDLNLSFASVEGKTYRIESKDDITAASWTLAMDQILAAGATTTITDFGAASLTKRFYRIVIEP